MGVFTVEGCRKRRAVRSFWVVRRNYVGVHTVEGEEHKTTISWLARLVSLAGTTRYWIKRRKYVGVLWERRWKYK